MFGLTSAKAIYGTLFFTTTLSLGGVLANRSFLTATGLVGSYGTAVALLNYRDKKIPDSISDEYRGNSQPLIDLEDRLDQLQEVFQALQLSTQENSLELNQELDRLLKQVAVQHARTDSLSLDSQEYFAQKCSELELNIDERLNQLQEVFQALQLSTEEDDRRLERELRLLLTRVNAQHAKTQRCVQSNRDKLKHRVAKLEGIISQNAAATQSQSTKSKALKLSLDSSTEPEIVIAPSPRPSKTIVFIDQSNFYHACEKMGIEPDYSSLMCMLTPDVGECEIRIYLGVYNRPSQKQIELNKKLEGLGYQVIKHPIVKYANGNRKVVGDDNQLTCDLLTMVLNGKICDRDQIVLMSDDGDFKPLLQQIKETGIGVELIAYRPSRYLIPLVDKVTRLDEIKYDICQHQRIA